MRTALLTMAAALLLTTGAAAQDAAKVNDVNPEVAPVNQLDLGIRGTFFSDGSDEARYQRYRDIRDGGTVDKFRVYKDTDRYRYWLQADSVGYRDQRFSASYIGYGKVKATAEWNQIPLYYSQTTSTLYDQGTPGALTMSDTIQATVQARPTALGGVLGTLATPFQLRTQRDIGSFALTYSATPSVDVNVTFKNTQKTGAYPWGGSFGISGAIAAEMPVPVDHRTTDIGTYVEYANDRGFLRAGYDGSFFHNNVPSLIFDNPGRVVDSPTAGPAQGRMALWPNTEMNTFSVSGGLSMPAHSHATAFISVANMTNNNPLMPYTINSAIASPTLFRPTSDVTAKVTAMNYTFTSRPVSTLWFSARYRQYDFDNRTVPFYTANSVNYDTSIVALNQTSEPFGSIRHTFDADATYSPVRHLGFRAGYTREEVERTYRVVENTTENIGRASVDLTGLGWATVRAVYEHSQRTGTAVDQLELLSIGEQPQLRQYDISDRNRDRVSTILTVMPVSQLSFNGTAGVGSQRYPGTYFGLRSSDSHFYSGGFDYVPSDKISLGATYGNEKYTALQASRTANPLPANTPIYLLDPTQQFNDPRRDWTDSSADSARTINASMDLIKLLPRLDIRVVYDNTRTESTYTYGLAPVTVLPAPVPLTPVTSELQRGTLDTRYFLTRRFAVGMVYWYDKYRVDDFALSPVASLAQPATGTPTLMMLGYFYAPYTANTLMARLTVLW